MIIIGSLWTEEGRTDSPTSAKGLATSPRIARSRMGKVQGMETGEGNKASTGEGVNVCCNFIYNKYKDVTDDLERLDILNGFSLEEF